MPSLVCTTTPLELVRFHFVNKETGSERLGHLPIVIQPAGGLCEHRR